MGHGLVAVVWRVWEERRDRGWAPTEPIRLALDLCLAAHGVLRAID